MWAGLKYQMYQSNDEFIERMQHKFGDLKKEQLKEVSRLQRRPLARSVQWCEENTTDRKIAMAQAYASGECSMKEISEWFSVHYSTVSRAVKSFEASA